MRRLATIAAIAGCCAALLPGAAGARASAPRCSLARTHAAGSWRPETLLLPCNWAAGDPSDSLPWLLAVVAALLGAVVGLRQLRSGGWRRHRAEPPLRSAGVSGR